MRVHPVIRDTLMSGHPVIRGHSDERICDQDTLMRGHPVFRGHSDERTPRDQGHSDEWTPCDQGTL